MLRSVVRSSDRVEIAIPIQVIAEDLTTGTTFFRDCETSVVSRDGATVALNCVLSVNQELTVRCLPTNKEVKARVVGLVEGKSKELVYGLAFLEADGNPWGIEFPPLTQAHDGLVRLLMSCEGCGRTEVVHLNEIELEIFASNHSLRRPCPSCHAMRSWTQNAESTTTPKPATPVAREEPSGAAANVGVANRRKDRRVRTAISACIRRPSFNEELVTCEDVSRGGIRFRSQKEYSLNGRIEVAVPCTPRTANIYVLGRVAHVRRIGESFVVGVAFLPDAGLRATSGNSVV